MNDTNTQQGASRCACRTEDDARFNPTAGDIVDGREVTIRCGNLLRYLPPSRLYTVRTTVKVWAGRTAGATVQRVAQPGDHR